MKQHKIPRPEYPRPQFERDEWLCLNGEWEFEIDNSDSGYERKLYERPLTDRIIVPFCPESKLSGIENTDFMNAVWYRREVQIPERWQGQKVLLHFGAVDYDATVWANGVEVGRHRGGFTPFWCDLSEVVSSGQPATIVVRARDNANQPQPRGKQSQRYENYQCLYTRTTGIWQTVWLEPLSPVHLKRPRITPDVANHCFHIEIPLSQNAAGHNVQVTLLDGETVISKAECRADVDFAPHLTLSIPEEKVLLWSCENAYLYNLKFELTNADGAVIDSVRSYAGLRSIAVEGQQVKLNGQPVFQRLVLDQGYYPDGIMTAPDDDALRRDIELAQAAGFNGARLHQKVFEERFLYHADRLGYLCWGEFPDWGCRDNEPVGVNSHLNPQFGLTVAAQWLEELERDYSHPCIVGWCALNETLMNTRYLHETPDERTRRHTLLSDATLALFLAAKAMDRTRPVLDVSGYSHRLSFSDIYDCHDYAQDPEQLRANHAGLKDGKPFHNHPDGDVPYRGQPYFNSEFGGTWWSGKADDSSWGYGNRPKDLEEFYTRFAALCAVLLENPAMFGYCYTQLADVYQEQNGIYHFDRSPKFDLARLRAAQGEKQ
jgi:beta-galactosidase/beta-glucuronidase